jgi:DNA-binding transcriptional MocR family regulator
MIVTRETQNDVFSASELVSHFSPPHPLHFILTSPMIKRLPLFRPLSKHSFQSKHPFSSLTKSLKMGEATQPKKTINLLRGWPNPSLFPTLQIKAAANAALSNASVSTPGLLYGPDPGYQPLRESIAGWLDGFYRPTTEQTTPPTPAQEQSPDAERICITGGASQNLACVLQVFTDPVFTQAWMVAPCYFLACRIFEDAGLRTRAVLEGEEGVDLRALEKSLQESKREVVSEVSAFALERRRGEGLWRARD